MEAGGYLVVYAGVWVQRFKYVGTEPSVVVVVMALCRGEETGGTELPTFLVPTLLDKRRAERCIYWDRWACAFQEQCGISGLGRSSLCIFFFPSLSTGLPSHPWTASRDLGLDIQALGSS